MLLEKRYSRTHSPSYNSPSVQQFPLTCSTEIYSVLMEKPTVQNLLPIQICTFITIRQKFKLKLKIKQIIISRLKDERQFDFHVLLLSSSSFYYT